MTETSGETAQATPETSETTDTLTPGSSALPWIFEWTPPEFEGQGTEYNILRYDKLDEISKLGPFMRENTLYVDYKDNDLLDRIGVDVSEVEVVNFANYGTPTFAIPDSESAKSYFEDNHAAKIEKTEEYKGFTLYKWKEFEKWGFALGEGFLLRTGAGFDRNEFANLRKRIDFYRMDPPPVVNVAPALPSIGGYLPDRPSQYWKLYEEPLARESGFVVGLTGEGWTMDQEGDTVIYTRVLLFQDRDLSEVTDSDIESILGDRLRDYSWTREDGRAIVIEGSLQS